MTGTTQHVTIAELVMEAAKLMQQHNPKTSVPARSGLRMTGAAATVYTEEGQNLLRDCALELEAWREPDYMLVALYARRCADYLELADDRLARHFASLMTREIVRVSDKWNLRKR